MSYQQEIKQRIDVLEQERIRHRLKPDWNPYDTAYDKELEENIFELQEELYFSKGALNDFSD